MIHIVKSLSCWFRCNQTLVLLQKHMYTKKFIHTFQIHSRFCLKLIEKHRTESEYWLLYNTRKPRFMLAVLCLSEGQILFYIHLKVKVTEVRREKINGAVTSIFLIIQCWYISKYIKQECKPCIHHAFSIS